MCRCARNLIKEMLDIMIYLHDDIGIVHRDLKPENFLMQSERDDHGIKLVDFGFACRIRDLEENKKSLGTPVYVAPEILRGDSYASGDTIQVK